MKSIDIQELENGIRLGNRSALSRAITLAESTIAEHQKQAQELIQKLLPLTGNSKRIAITGVPGVGKSTFIESFGKLVTGKGLNVAVLAIDPSSYFSKGSILGDKTRMEELAKNPHAFIRPSATGGFLGGIASRTFEAVLLCEAAGFDVILIETVGVGQSETLVNEITDMFIFLQIPGGGDDLQGIKRGIMEMADVIFVNKVDDFGIEKSKEVKITLSRSLQFLPQKDSGWKRKILLGSGLNSSGLNEVWNSINDYFEFVTNSGYLKTNRKHQIKLRIDDYVKEIVLSELKNKDFSAEIDLNLSPFEMAQNWLNHKKINQ